VKAAAVATGSGLAFVLGLAMVAGAAAGTGVTSEATLAGELAQTCVVSGPVPGLSAAQASNADAIVAATFVIAAESLRAAQIALMTAITESGLNNDLPGAGGLDSVGLFQQRVTQGWGTTAEEMNPTDATEMFARRLLAVPNWATMAPWLAAQAVQRSAFPDGSNYKPNWAKAGVYLAAVLGNGNSLGGCGQGVPKGVAGPDHGLPAGYSIPPGTGPLHAHVVAFTLAQLGKPYLWAAAGPDDFDCSGLTMAAWATVGVTLLHYTGDQQGEGVDVTEATLMAGDLVLVPGSDSPGPGIAGHVGIYLGYGLVESAIDPQLGVAVQTWQTFTTGGLDALRNPDPAD
jgi:cell wall-associated NlpC family hydrolase